MPRHVAICVYCGSSVGHNPVYRSVAQHVGRRLAEEGIRLVYGGGRIGLMGLLADSVLERGGEVTGVIPEFLSDREVAHQGIGDLRIVSDMHSRKALMAQEADAFLAIPGGFGTLEEIFEIITWSQLELHEKPIGILNSEGYFDGMKQQICRSIDDGLIRQHHANIVRFGSDADELLSTLISLCADQHSSTPDNQQL